MPRLKPRKVRTFRLTVRDEFAKEALAPLIEEAARFAALHDGTSVAKKAYMIADAMMNERKSPKGNSQEV